MMETNKELNFLRNKGFRVTPQRLAIFEILQEADCHLLAGDIYRIAAQNIPGINEATVYRTLEFFVHQGIVHRSYHEGNQIAYEIAKQHHHLICKSCSHEIEIDDEFLWSAYKLIEESTGFQLDSSHLNFYGLCPKCSQSSAHL